MLYFANYSRRKMTYRHIRQQSVIIKNLCQKNYQKQTNNLLKLIFIPDIFLAIFCISAMCNQ